MREHRGFKPFSTDRGSHLTRRVQPARGRLQPRRRLQGRRPPARNNYASSRGRRCRNLTVEPREQRPRRENQRRGTPDRLQRAALCSFCRKSQRQVKKLMAGPGVYISTGPSISATRSSRQAGPRRPLFGSRACRRRSDQRRAPAVHRRSGHREAGALVAVPNHYKRVQMSSHHDDGSSSAKSNIISQSDRLWQDTARPDARADSQRLVRDRGFDRAHRAGYVGEDVETSCWLVRPPTST